VTEENVGAPTEEQMIRLVARALRALEEAVRAMTAETTPRAPMPRPRVFVLGRYREDRQAVLRWPYVGGNTVQWGWVEAFRPNAYPHTWGLFDDRQNEEAARVLVRECAWGRPAEVLRIIGRIEAATNWCRARAEGRRRHAEEILRQQARAAEVLRALEVLEALGERP